MIKGIIIVGLIITGYIFINEFGEYAEEINPFNSKEEETDE